MFVCLFVCFNQLPRVEQEGSVKLAKKSIGIIVGIALVLKTTLVHVRYNIFRIFLDNPNFK